MRTGPAHRFARAADDPGAAQAARLTDILGRNADTVYGEIHDFAGIRTPEDYRQRVPIMTPEALQRWVGRTMEGERGLITAEPPVYYACTTGSTGERKHIPITETATAEYQQSVMASLWHLNARFPRAFTGRGLYVVGELQDHLAPDGVPVGSMSGYTFSTLPRAVRSLYAWPGELFDISHQRTWRYLALHLAIVGDPTFAACVFPVSLVLLFRELEQRADELAFHLERGTLPDDLKLQPAQRSFFEALVSPRPDLARRLRMPGPVATRAFPRLRLAWCWTGATAAAYVPELERRLGPEVAVRDAVYSASEGWINVPMGDDEPGGPLAVTGHYLEFLPEGETDGRRAVGAAELEDGARYKVLLTTSAGLYRYDLGDIIEVDGLWRSTPIVRFVRKEGAAVSLVGELLEESHVNAAVAHACDALGISLTWFCMVPTPGADAAYTLVAEPTSDVDPLALGRAVDAGLCRAAFAYRYHRLDGSLGPVGARVLPAGSYQVWRDAVANMGTPVAQLKAAHLVPEVARIPGPLWAMGQVRRVA